MPKYRHSVATDRTLDVRFSLRGQAIVSPKTPVKKCERVCRGFGNLCNLKPREAFTQCHAHVTSAKSLKICYE